MVFKTGTSEFCGISPCSVLYYLHTAGGHAARHVGMFKQPDLMEENAATKSELRHYTGWEKRSVSN